MKSMEAYFIFTFFSIMCGMGPMRKHMPLTACSFQKPLKFQKVFSGCEIDLEQPSQSSVPFYSAVQTQEIMILNVYMAGVILSQVDFYVPTKMKKEGLSFHSLDLSAS